MTAQIVSILIIYGTLFFHLKLQQNNIGISQQIRFRHIIVCPNCKCATDPSQLQQQYMPEITHETLSLTLIHARTRITFKKIRNYITIELHFTKYILYT